MNVTPLRIPDLLEIEPRVFEDARGYFYESFNQKQFEDATGQVVNFVQDNHSMSVRHALRGLHYQLTQPQGKLLRVVEGSVFDVAVDLRRSSATFGQWVGHVLSAGNRKQLWIPEGFAHGFMVLSEQAQVLYKTTRYYAPEDEHCIAWNDPDLAIDWPLDGTPIVSAKDAGGEPFRAAPYFA